MPEDERAIRRGHYAQKKGREEMTPEERGRLEQKRERFVRQMKALGVHDEIEAICIKGGVADTGFLFTGSQGNGRGGRGSRHVSKARQDVILFLKERFDWSFATLASYFDFDHSSVMYAIKRAEERRKREQ